MLVYSGMFTFGTVTIFMLVALAVRAVRPIDLVIPYYFSSSVENRWANSYPGLSPPLIPTLGFFMICMLFALVVEHEPPTSRAIRICFRVAYFVFFVGIMVVIATGLPLQVYMGPACTGLYLCSSIFHGVRQRRKRV